MKSIPHVPLTAEASSLLDRLMPRIEQRLEEAHRVPVSILLWGPGVDSTSPLAVVRLDLRQRLRADGHAAFFSEELCKTGTCDSVRLQQLAQAQEFDLVVSTPCTPGSLGEVHDFVADRRVNAKTMVFLDEEHTAGYSSQSLEAISTIISCQIEYYSGHGDTASIARKTTSEVQKIREMKYILAGRY